MKKYLPLILIFGAISCSRGDDRSELAANIPGEDSSLAVLPGQGINHVTWKPKGFCVAVEGFKTQSGQELGQLTEYRFLEITSETALRESLNISASASLRYGSFGGGSARFNFSQSVKKNANSRYLLVQTRVGNQLKIGTKYTYTDLAQKLLKGNRKSEFTEQCGTEFVYAFRTGGEFFALFEFEFFSLEEESHFDAAIQASGLRWKAAASINEDLARFNTSARVQVRILRLGGTDELPEVQNLNDFALAFPKIVNAVNGQAVTLELISKDYTGVEPIDLKPNPLVVDRQEWILNQVAQNRDQADELYNTILYIKKNRSGFDGFDEVRLSATEKELTAYINRQFAATVDCFADIINSCQLPEVVMPTVILPAKKYSPSEMCDGGFSWHPGQKKCCRKEIIMGVCRIPGPNGTCLVHDVLREQLKCK